MNRNLIKHFFWKLLLPSLVILSPFIVLIFLQTFNQPLAQEVIYLALKHYVDSISEDIIKLLGNSIDIILCILVSCILLRYFRRRNIDKVFNDEDGYYTYPYFIYFYASKILNFGTVSLINVPVEMQYRLVLNKTFQEIQVGEYTEIESEIIEKAEHINKKSREVNLLLSDTYPLDIEKMPSSKQELPTYLIQSRKSPDGVRIYNPKFVNHTRKRVSGLSEKFDRVNVYSYTNPRHNYEIINSSFRTGNRSGFLEVYVYRSGGNPDYKFEEAVRIK